MSLRVLISGGGIAGPVCAYWLNRLSSSSIKTTVVERYNGLRTAGQQIDIRGAGVQVIKRMGVEEAIRAQTTHEEGLAFVDGRGRRVAEFPLREGGTGFTCDIEIVRQNLVKIFYDATKNDTEYIFGKSITDLKQDEEKTTIKFDDGVSKDFDLVIGADGMWSKTRKLAFPEIKEPVKSLGLYISYFTIPYESHDGTYSQWYNAVGGRSFLIRPDNVGCSRAFMSIMSNRPAGYHKFPIPEQKALMRELFMDAGWQAERIIKGMEKADDFYMQEVAQVRIPSWSNGRVALIGDAGYCPSVMSGMGTTSAIVGAYVLAGEIARAGNDFKTAFRSYEEKMRPYMNKAQKLPPGVPDIMNPKTKMGIKVFRGAVSFAAWSRIFDFLGKWSEPPGRWDEFPVYES